MREARRRGLGVVLPFLGILTFTACDIAEPEGPRLGFNPSVVHARVGEPRDFIGFTSVGTPYGTWFRQPGSVTIATVEITGPLAGKLVCEQQGSGAMVLSVGTSAGMASGSLYFTCSL